MCEKISNRVAKCLQQIFLNRAMGKPAEKRGRKAIGSKALVSAMIAWLPNSIGLPIKYGLTFVFLRNFV